MNKIWIPKRMLFANIVWKLDHMGRSLKHLIEVVNDLHEKGIGFHSLQENIDIQVVAQSLMRDPNYSIREICETLQMSKATLYRYLEKGKSRHK